MMTSLFSHAFSKIPTKDAPVLGVLKAIRNGKWKDKIERLRKIHDPKEFATYKKGLPGFTVTGLFERRNDADFLEHSGLVQVDIDSIQDSGKDYEEVWDLVCACPYTFAAFKSPSGRGIKALVKCPPDRAQHSGSYRAAADWLGQREITVDKTVCALSQLCFVSYDPDTYINKKAETITPMEPVYGETLLEEFEEARSEDEVLRACEERYGKKFLDLWEGDYDDYVDEFGEPDHSKGDFNLIAMLRDNCHSNEMVADLFAASGLAREGKWSGRTRDYVLRALTKTETVKVLSMFEVIPDDPADPVPKKKRQVGWSWDSVSDIADWKPENENYAIKNILYAGTSACIYGPSGSGKTFCVFSMAAAVAMGGEWQGHRVTQGAVMYFGLEGHHGVTKRLQAMRKAGQITNKANLARVNFNRVAMNLLKEEHVTRAKETIDAYEKHCGMKVALVIIDTLARATPGGDENSSQDMGVAAVNALAIAERTGAAVLIVHHSGKNAALGMRGSTALPAAFDSIYEVNRFEKNHDYRVFRVKKQRDDSDSAELFFKLDVVELGLDNDGDMATSCLVKFVPREEVTGAGEIDDTVLAAVTDAGTDGIGSKQIIKAACLNATEVNASIKRLSGKVEFKDGKYYPLGGGAPGFKNVDDGL